MENRKTETTERNTVVIKRDGRTQEFETSRIKKVINSAMSRTEKGIDEALSDKISLSTSDKFKDKTVSVEDIQNYIEKELMKSSRKDVAKEYIKERQRRDIAREAKTKDIFMSIINTENNDVTRENANMCAETPAGQMMKFSSETTKNFAKNYLLSDEAKEAFFGNFLHIHDLDYSPTKSLTCLQHPLNKILKNGFKAGHGEARPSKRIETASILACISMESIQNEMHGGQAVPALDFYMAPYVRETYKEELEKAFSLLDLNLTDKIKNEIFKDYEIKNIGEIRDPINKAKQAAMNQTVKRVHQAMESFIHNLNTIHSRGGNQVVFSSVNYGTDTSAEGRCVIRELLLSTERGVGDNRTAIFPIQIWKLKKGVSRFPEDPNYDLYKLSCRVTSKRFFPNYLNLDSTFNFDDRWKENDPERYMYEVATMGCRTRVYENHFGIKTSVGRGNLSFTTVNFVKLAIESSIEDGFLINEGTFENPKYTFNWSRNTREDKERRINNFKEKVKQYTGIAARQLDNRYKFQATAFAKQFPMLMSGMWVGSENLEPNDTIESVINQGTLGIGFIGLAEALVAMTGKHHAEDENCQRWGLETISMMKEEVDNYSEIMKHNYSVLATPAEGLSGKFTKVDKKTFGEIPGITDREFYTNSNHVPVYYQCSVKHKAEIEGPYHDLTRGGHIFYTELDGDASKNPECIMDIIDLACGNNIGYISVNHFQSRCSKCGYETVKPHEYICPSCNHELETLQRITGYLVGTTDRWNSGKLGELKARIQHTFDDK